MRYSKRENVFKSLKLFNVSIGLLIERFGYESQAMVRPHCYGEAALWARILRELCSYSLSSFSPGGECFHLT